MKDFEREISAKFKALDCVKMSILPSPFLQQPILQARLGWGDPIWTNHTVSQYHYPENLYDTDWKSAHHILTEMLKQILNIHVHLDKKNPQHPESFADGSHMNFTIGNLSDLAKKEVLDFGEAPGWVKEKQQPCGTPWPNTSLIEADCWLDFISAQYYVKRIWMWGIKCVLLPSLLIKFPRGCIDLQKPTWSDHRTWFL